MNGFARDSDEVAAEAAAFNRPISERRSAGFVPGVRCSETINVIREQFLDSAKAEKMLGWRARFGFEAGLARTIDWYRSHLGATD